MVYACCWWYTTRTQIRVLNRFLGVFHDLHECEHRSNAVTPKIFRMLCACRTPIDIIGDRLAHRVLRRKARTRVSGYARCTIFPRFVQSNFPSTVLNFHAYALRLLYHLRRRCVFNALVSFSLSVRRPDNTSDLHTRNTMRIYNTYKSYKNRKSLEIDTFFFF